MVTLTTPAAAQNWNCAAFDTLPQQGLNYCTYVDWQEADAQLNQVWPQVREAMKARDEYGDRRDGKSEAEVLLQMQRAWITYRDLVCDMAGIHFRGGSGEAMLRNSCLADQTRRQTNFLLSLMAP